MNGVIAGERVGLEAFPFQLLIRRIAPGVHTPRAPVVLLLAVNETVPALPISMVELAATFNKPKA